MTTDKNVFDKLNNYKKGDDPGAFKPLQPLKPYERQPPEFPADNLGPLKDAALELADAIQIPIEVAGLSLLTSTAVASQALHDVDIDGRQFPCSLFGLVILESGGGGEKRNLKSIV